MPYAAAQQHTAGAADGAALFQTYCAYCHGSHGEGGRGADLTTGEYQHGSSDNDLFSTIRYGVRGTEMPATGVNDDEAWKLVAFVKSIGSQGAKEVAPGDAGAGKQVYARSGCASCHSIDKQGGAIGPDLSDVGRRRNLKYIEESIVKPDADIPVQYRAIQVVTKSGQTINGIRLNEDDISIQVRDLDDNLRSFLKADIREIRHDKPSLMPSYTSLSRKDLDDLVSYLHSLRGAQ
ncbi:MAG TPA: c-type cytochrome [Bryobacteraceae bacterium]|nr:c-type cytochrome [Bryobacteraceae bacterium]